MRARPDTSPPVAVMQPGPHAPHLGDIAAGRLSPARSSARSADSSGELPAARSYAVLDGPEPVEVVLHPGFVTWAGRDYAVVSRADDPNPTRPAWSVIASASLLGLELDDELGPGAGTSGTPSGSDRPA